VEGEHLAVATEEELSAGQCSLDSIVFGGRRDRIKT
jgi:hypothetical protein